LTALHANWNRHVRHAEIESAKQNNQERRQDPDRLFSNFSNSFK